MAVVKANGYGHGAVPSARAALEGGASWLGVSSVGEGVELRKAGIDAPILNLGYTPPAALSAAIAARLALTLYDEAGLRMLKGAGTEMAIHVKVDTGMHRLGAPREEAVRLAKAVHDDPNLKLEGFWTHFADSDGDLDFTRAQLDRFLEARQALTAQGVQGFLSHAANSAGLLRIAQARLDLVRAGLIVYGVRPVRNSTDLPGLRPALAWRTVVTNVVDVPVGDTVGYGRRFKAKGAPARVATNAVGYADGLPRVSANGGSALVRGRKVPIAGTISMDQAALDVTAVPEVRVGETVTLIGEDGGTCQSADDMADAAGTIAYEVLCAISSRVQRRYN